MVLAIISVMKAVDIIGVPIDLGGNRRGVDMGPSAIRVTDLANRIRKLGCEVYDRGDIDVPLPEECAIGDEHKKFADAIKNVCEDIYKATYKSAKEGHTPVVLGGDHTVAMGSIAGVGKYFKEQNKSIGVIWFDAHGDMNTPQSTNSGNVHGMPLSHVLGVGDNALSNIGGFSPKVSPANTVLVGIRNLDEREKKLVADSRVVVFTMKDIDRNGMGNIVEEAIEIALSQTDGIHISFDMDVVDPMYAPGVGTPVRGGINYREAHLIMEMIADSGKLTSLDIVEINPILDTKNHTAELGAELILSALGKRIF